MLSNFGLCQDSCSWETAANLFLFCLAFLIIANFWKQNSNDRTEIAQLRSIYTHRPNTLEIPFHRYCCTILSREFNLGTAFKSLFKLSEI